MAPPIAVISEASKPVGAVEKVKVMVADCPGFNLFVLEVIATAGEEVSTDQDTEAFAPRAFPAASDIPDALKFKVRT